MNYKAFFAAYKTSVQRGNRQTYKDIVYQFTSGRTDSLTALSFAEVQELTRSLNKLNGSQMPKEDKRVKMQRKIIAMAHEIGWNLPTSPKGVRKIDMLKLNEWCTKTSYLSKEFNKYTYEELPRLVAQFERVYHFYIKKLN